MGLGCKGKASCSSVGLTTLQPLGIQLADFKYPQLAVDPYRNAGTGAARQLPGPLASSNQGNRNALEVRIIRVAYEPTGHPLLPSANSTG